MSLRRLTRSLSLTWAAAWLTGLGLLAGVAISQAFQLQRQDLDARLALHGMAVYGLGWYDAQGRYHAELLEREPELIDSDFDTWVAQPGDPLKLNLAPSSPRLPAPALAEIVTRVSDHARDLFLDRTAIDGTPLRVHALPTFADNDDSRPNGAVVVVGDRTRSEHAWRAFATRLLSVSGGLLLLGLAVGLLLARRSLRPVTLALDQRERFVTAAAHELRGPVASLAAVCDSARAGDEDAGQALERIAGLVQRTGRTVDDLLLYARLDAGGAALERRAVRLDLLVETCLPEDGSIPLRQEAGPVTLMLDERLVRVALRLLITNACTHGESGAAPPRVRVDGTGVCVEDRGPGFPTQVLSAAHTAFPCLPSASGAGLGLALARMIGELHGGGLLLENREGGGARVVLTLTPDA